MNSIKRKTALGLLIILMIVVCVFTASILAVSAPQKSTDALTSTTGAINLGKGKDIWDDTLGKFDGDVLEEFTDKVFGTENWNEFVKTRIDSQTQSYVIPASTINAKMGNTTQGVVVKLGGLDWIVTSLTLTNDDKQDVVMTLYLANSSSISTNFYSRYGNVGDTMYSCSNLRKRLNSENMFKLFSDGTTEGSFASIYLVQPKNIKYQLNQTDYNRGASYNHGNDALGEPLNGRWDSAGRYSPGQIYNGAKYEDWGEDYIWIPSMAETGVSSKHIWQLTSQQCAAAKRSWLRSGACSERNNIYCMNASGSQGYDYATASMAIRPAIHLNLTEAVKNSIKILTNPEDVTKTYNANDQDVKDSDWYKTEIFDDSEFMKVEYLNETGTAIATPHNAGKYKVRFTILNKDACTWSTDDGEDFRDIIFEIKPKEVGFTWGENADKIPIITEFDSNDVISGDSVKFIVHYKSTSVGNDHDSTDLPKKVGWYTATAKIDNSNYVAKAPIDKSFELKIRNISLPTIAPSNTRVYNGAAQNFVFTYDSQDIILERPSKFNDSHYTLNSDKTMATAKMAGDYFVNLKLVDTDNTQWSGGGNEDRELQFKITSASLVLDITDGEIIDCIVNTNQSIHIEVMDAPKGNDEVVIDFVATFNGGMEQTLYSGLSVTKDDVSFDIDLEIVKLPISGVWDLKLQLRDGVSANVNYTLDCEIQLKVQEESEDGNDVWRLKAGNSNVGNPYRSPGGTLNVRFPNAVVYDGRTFSMTLRPSSATGHTVDTQYNEDGYVNGYKTVASNANNSDVGKNADIYTTYVRLLDSNNTPVIYSIEWEITKAKFDLTNVKWRYDGKIPFSTNSAEMKAEIDITTMPKGLIVKRYDGLTSGSASVKKGRATVVFDYDTTDDSYANNYILPIQGDKTTYIYTASESLTDFEWSKDWEIVKMEIALEWEGKETVDGSGNKYVIQKLKEDKNVIEYEYYLWDTATNTVVGEAISEYEIEVEENKIKYYVGKAVIKSIYKDDVELKGEEYSQPFGVGIGATGVKVSLTSETMTYNGNEQGVKLKIEGALSESDFDIEYYDRGGTAQLGSAPTNVGQYSVRIKLKSGIQGFYLEGADADGFVILNFEIKPMSVNNGVWVDSHNPPSLQLNKKEILGVTYEYMNMEGNALRFEDLKAGGSYQVRAVIKDKNNYAFADGSFETEWKEFTVSANEQLFDPTDPNNPYYPTDDNTPITPPDDTKPSDDDGALDEIIAKLRDLPLWQLATGSISIIMILICMGKTASYENRRKRAKKTVNEKYSTYYAGLFMGVAFSGWTAIACALMGLAAASVIITLVAKSKCRKAEDELATSKEEYNKMMFMRMIGNGGNMQQPQGVYMNSQPYFGADEMRGMITEAVSAMLPNVQQYLPQQASSSDEVIKKLTDNQEIIMKKLLDQSSEKIIERQVSSSNANDELLRQLIDKSQKNDETIAQLMEKILELSSEQNHEPQVIEKIVEKEVKVEVPIEVEKIVEKVIEKPVEVEKVVEKEVKVKVATAAKPKKETAPRLTLDEAYEKLTKQQKKFFDGLREYAMSKDKCKEKKSTYFIVLGQSSVNPLIKLTVKKDTTVALFKMEDEYLKDIRRNAGSDGTKVKVKETEVIIGDAQAYATAKEMIDLREDQIERYAEYLKEQKAMR